MNQASGIDVIAILGLVLTVVALAIAVWQSLAAREQTAKLASIGDALSTRYLGEFPDYLPQIAALLSKARREILVVCAIPCHGVYSSQEGWLQAKHAIESALSLNKRVKVSCVFADKENRNALIENQFRNQLQEWESWRSDPQNLERIAHFLCKFGSSGRADDLTKEEFLNLFELASQEDLRTTFKGADVMEVNHRPPFYMWVVDGVEAIFSVATTIPSYSAQSFITTDARLIAALVGMHKEYSRSISK